MDVQEALRTHLEDEPAIRRMFGPRLFSSAVPGTASYPLVSYSVTNVDPDMCLDGEIGTSMARIIYTVAANKQSDAKAGMRLLARRLNGLNLVSIAGVWIEHVILQGGTYEVELDVDAGEGLPPYAEAGEFEVYYQLAAADPQPEFDPDEPSGPPPPDPDPDPEDPSLPAWPALVPSAEMVEAFGDSGSWDTGITKRATYAVPATHWYGDSIFTWYPAKYNAGTGYPSPLTVTDWANGLPDGVAIHQGTINRVLANKPQAMLGWYTSLLRTATANTLAAEGIWPIGRAIETGDYDSAWFNPAYNTPIDLRVEEKGIAYQTAACREVHGREYARMVSRIKALHPQLSMVYSDNFAARDVVPTIDWSSLCLLAKSATAKMREEFGIALALVCNVTCHYRTDLRADLDALANADVAGIHNEGLFPEHTTRTTEWTNVVRNIQYWLAKTWPGGGRRYFASLARSTNTDGMNRVVQINSATPAANSIDITLAGPHYLADTSVWRVSTSGFHASLTSDYAVTPHASDPNRLTLTLTGAPGSGYSTGAGSTLCFLYSGRDVDAGILHSLRKVGDCCRASWIHGSGDSRSYVPPLWRTWASTYGYAIGQPEKLSDHTVNLADYSSSGTVQCVEHFRTPFSSGWYLHVNLSKSVRRTWWNNGS